MPRSRAARGTYVNRLLFEQPASNGVALSQRRWRKPVKLLGISAALLVLCVGTAAGFALWQQRSTDSAPATAEVVGQVATTTVATAIPPTEELSVPSPPSTAIVAPSDRGDDDVLELELEEQVVGGESVKPRKNAPDLQVTATVPRALSKSAELARTTVHKVGSAHKTLDAAAPSVASDAPQATTAKAIESIAPPSTDTAGAPAPAPTPALGAIATPAVPTARSIDDLIDDASPVVAAVKTQESDAPAKQELDRADIKKAFSAIRGRMLSCATLHDGHGTAQLRVTVGPDGRVSSPRVSGGAFSAEFIRCAEAAADRLRFPAFEGNPTSVTYPFLLAR